MILKSHFFTFPVNTFLESSSGGFHNISYAFQVKLLP